MNSQVTRSTTLSTSWSESLAWSVTCILLNILCEAASFAIPPAHRDFSTVTPDFDSCEPHGYAGPTPPRGDLLPTSICGDNCPFGGLVEGQVEATQFRYVIKFVADMNKAVTFYRDMLGLSLDRIASLE